MSACAATLCGLGDIGGTAAAALSAGSMQPSPPALPPGPTPSTSTEFGVSAVPAIACLVDGAPACARIENLENRMHVDKVFD
jgi:hypothetical protein